MADLRAVVEEQAETIRQLRAAALGQQDDLAACGMFSPIERRIVGVLLAHGRVSFETILVAVYGENMENASGGTVRVRISSIRRKLAARGLSDAIRLVWGFGYEIGPEQAAVLQGMIVGRSQ